jgi:cytochrome c551/c552
MRKKYLKIGILGIIVVVTLAIAGINGTIGAEETGPKAIIKNEICLECHDVILGWKTKKKDVKQPHLLHLESKRTEYNGRQKMCVTCHEAMVPTEAGTGILDSDVYHPDVASEGIKLKKYIQRKEVTSGSPYLDAVHPEKPYTFKPVLERLVCVDCHGHDSKVKTLYGMSLKEN